MVALLALCMWLIIILPALLLFNEDKKASESSRWVLLITINIYSLTWTLSSFKPFMGEIKLSN